MKLHRALFGVLAAVLFGASTPFAKLLVRDVHPLLLAGLLYLGSGIGLFGLFVIRKVAGFRQNSFLGIRKKEMLYLAGAIIFGGILAPVLLMGGLSKLAASTSSLLLNIEGALTALLACLVFHEHYGKRLVVGLGFILCGGIILALGQGNPLSGNWIGVFMIVAACCGWAIDNNFTKQVASLDAILLAGLKGMISGVVNIFLALALGQQFPERGVLAVAAFIGFVGYGLSLLLFILSLRNIGTARTSAYFSTAPFVGAAVSMGLFHDQFTMKMLAASTAMAIGVYLHVTEKPQSVDSIPNIL